MQNSSKKLEDFRMATNPKTGETFAERRCFVCGRWFQFDAHIYRGRWVNQYSIPLCDWCDSGNADGFPEPEASRIEAHLRASGLSTPSRNAKGFLPLPGKFG